MSKGYDEVYNALGAARAEKNAALTELHTAQKIVDEAEARYLEANKKYRAALLEIEAYEKGVWARPEEEPAPAHGDSSPDLDLTSDDEDGDDHSSLKVRRRVGSFVHRVLQAVKDSQPCTAKQVGIASGVDKKHVKFTLAKQKQEGRLDATPLIEKGVKGQRMLYSLTAKGDSYLQELPRAYEGSGPSP